MIFVDYEQQVNNLLVMKMPDLGLLRMKQIDKAGAQVQVKFVTEF